MAASSSNFSNSTWNLANILFYPVAFLAATPFFINRLGEDVFGIWMLINAYVYIGVNIAGLGLPNSITVHVAGAAGRNDRSLLHAYVNAASGITARMSLIALALTIPATILYFSGIYLFDDDTWKALIMATALIAVKFPEQLYQSIFKGFERYDQSALYNMLNRFLALAAQVIIVMKGYGLFELFTATLVINLIVVIVQAFRIYSGMRGYNPLIWKLPEEKKDIFHFGFWTWLQTLISVVAFQLDRFIVAWYLGTATVAYYVLASTIANHLHMAFEAVVSWLFPKIARLREGNKDTRSHFFTIRSFSIGFSLLLITGLWMLSEPLFTLWLGAEKYEKMIDFFKLFMVFECFLIMTIVPKIYLNGVRMLRFVTMLELMFKSAIIGGMVAGFAFFGTAESLILGQAIALMAIMPMAYLMINSRILALPSLNEALFTLIPPSAIAVMILLPVLPYTFAVLPAGVIFFYLYYVKGKYFDLRLIRE